MGIGVKAVVMLHLVGIFLSGDFWIPEVLSAAAAAAAETPNHVDRPSLGSNVEPSSRVSTSNTTLSPEFVRQMRERERARQRHLLMTLTSVLHSTALNTRPNVTGTISKKDLEDIRVRMEVTLSNEEKNNGDLANEHRIRRIQTLLPSCEFFGLFENRSQLEMNEMRLFFKVVPQDRIRKTDRIKVNSANLVLKRKPLTNEAGRELNWNEKEKRKRGRPPTSHLDNWKVRIKIYKLNDRKRVLRTVPLGAWNSTGWMKISILKAVEDWYKSPKQNAGLEVTVVNARSKPVSPFQVFEDYSCRTSQSPGMIEETEAELNGEAEGGGRVIVHKESNITSFPHIEIVTTVMKKAPEKRRQRFLEPKKKIRCRMKNTYIKLEDHAPLLKDQMIIAPTGFSTGICQGTCPKCHSKPETANSTRNLFQSQMSSCCRPIRTSPLPVLLIDKKNTIHVSNIPDLIVNKCGCSLPGQGHRTRTPNKD